MSSEANPLILVVEDDPGAVVLQRRRLERAGFRVQVATEVRTAMEVLERGGVDLVVLDYRLGSTTGLELHRQMKAAGFDVPVIIVSGSTSDAIVIEAMRAGIRDVVVKNTGYLDYLPDAVRGILRQATAASDRVPQEHRRSRVLIVEDDEGLARLEQRQLERAGYEAVVATGVQEAQRQLLEGNVTLALLDLRLGNGASGLDLYEQMKGEGWKIPAILVTAYPEEAVAIRALRAGIRDFLPKSAGFLDRLPDAVDRVAAQARIERKLVESELRLASIIGTTMDAIVMCDDESRIVLFNRSAEDMFGCAAGAALGQRLEMFVPHVMLRNPAAPASHQPPGTIRQRMEVDGIRADGARLPIEVSVSDVVVHGRRLVTVIARDISERRRIEAELREADRRKDEFLGMLAHELRNPLAAITTASEVLDRTIGDGPAAHITAVVKRQTKVLARMVDDLLDVSRVTQGKIRLAEEPLVLSQVVVRTADSMRPTVEKAGLQFDVRVDPDPVWVRGDATRLEQVLTNLLTNAIKFTPAGGRIGLSAGREGAEAVVRVRDSGVGINPALLPTVFELFVQGDTSLDRSKSGLGIGLALVRQLVTLHHGHVSAFSEGPGRGSEFAVRLPVSAGPADQAGTEREVPVGDRPRMRVLVVDDQPDLADALALLIGTFGHNARAVYGGAAALAASHAEVPDVMLVDIGMPGMTGYDLARAIRQDPAIAGVRLVALTGYGREEDRARVFEAGFDLHLTKPVAESRLETVLTSLAPEAGEHRA